MIDISKVYSSNKYGDFTVVRYEDSNNVDIEFVSTGYRVTVQAGRVANGSVKDKLHPTVYNVGFIGDGSYKATVNYKTTKQYEAWKSMLRRCYSSVSLKVRPTYMDCYVCDEWLNFQNFAKWFDDNYINGYDLDKDIKIDGNKVYSPSTCLFVSTSENTRKAIHNRAIASTAKLKEAGNDRVQ